MEDLALKTDDRVLVLGAAGFVGKKLVPELAARNVKLRLFSRDAAKVRSLAPKGAHVEIAEGDLVEKKGLEEALGGIHTAYYLVHSLGGRSLFRNLEFAARDKVAARNFMAAANASGLRRIIYLGALGEEGAELSEHLQNRAEVAIILASGKPSATVLRAAIIIGAGGASFEMLRYLVERLPVMVCPRWIESNIQPLAIKDAVAYLSGCLLNPATAGQSFDIGGPEVFTYREMMQAYARTRGLSERLIIKVPLLTPLLSAYWVDLITPIPSGVAHPLIEGLVNDVVCRESRIEKFVPLKKTPFEEAVLAAVAEEKEGPGVTGF